MSPTEMQMLFAAGGSSLVCKASELDIPQIVSCLTMVHKLFSTEGIVWRREVAWKFSYAELR
jgi:hypothetical protein